MFCHTIQFGVHWFASGSGITNKSSLFVTTLRKQKEHSKTHRTPSGIFGQRNDWGMVIVLFGVLGFPLNLLQAGGVISISRRLIGFALRRVYPHTGNLGNQQTCLATSLLPFIRSGGRSAPARLFCKVLFHLSEQPHFSHDQRVHARSVTELLLLGFRIAWLGGTRSLNFKSWIYSSLQNWSYLHVNRNDYVHVRNDRAG